MAEADGAPLRGVHAREAEFHDRLAGEAPLEPPRAPDEWEAVILQALGDARNLRVLDLGCGDGELTLHLLEAGASITAVDISPGMAELARRRIERFRPGADAEVVVGPGESIPVAAGAFDAVVGKWVLHHMDVAAGAAEVNRVLRPGGRGIFVETSALNPLLAFARRQLVHRRGVGLKLGTADEHPLTRADLRTIGSRFREVRVDHPNFFLFLVFDRNVLGFRRPRVTERVWRLDAAIARRLPFMRPMSYYLRIQLLK